MEDEFSVPVVGLCGRYVDDLHVMAATDVPKVA
jgi:hypothetical protein